MGLVAGQICKPAVLVSVQGPPLQLAHAASHTLLQAAGIQQCMQWSAAPLSCWLVPAAHRAPTPCPELPPLSASPPSIPFQVSEAIQEENRLTGQVMDSLEGAMDQARASLKKTMRRLGRAYEQSRSNHMLYLILFALALFFGLYFWNRLYRLLKWIF